MIRKLAAALVTAGALSANTALGLGLGEITLNSSLNQPLNAEINLLQVRDLDGAEIRVRLAKASDFQRAGLDRDQFLSALKFDVQLDSKGSGRVNVSSRQPVSEPYLNFLVEVEWPNGRLLREYTLLLDLPVFSDAAVSSVAPSKSTSKSPSTTKKTAPRSSSGSRPGASSTAASTTTSSSASQAPFTGDQWPVGEYDTLWSIALKTRPGRDVSPQQMMLALQEANPNAFINGNINLLRKGAVLKVPSASELSQYNRGESAARVAEQNREVRAGKQQIDATKRSYSSNTGTSSTGSGRLDLAVPNKADSSAAAQGSGSSRHTAQLENELALTLENLDKAKLENDDMQGRMSELEEQLQTMQALISLKDEEMAALQQRLAAAGEEVEISAAQPAPTEVLPSSEDSATDTGAAATSSADVEAGDDAASIAGADDESQAAAVIEEDDAVVAGKADKPAVDDKESAKKPVVVKQSEPEPSPIDQLLNNPLVLAGIVGGLVVILLIARLLLRRRSDDDQTPLGGDSSESFDIDNLSLNDTTGEPSLGLAETTAVDIGDDLDFGDADSTPAGVDSVTAADEFSSLLDASTATAEVAADDAELTKPETADAIGESDIYIAYGRFQQAVDLLQEAINDEPERGDLRLKLLEVFTETQDAQGFERHYAQLQELGNPADIERANQIRSRLPELGLGDDDDSFAGGLDLSGIDLDKPLDSGAADLSETSDDVAAVEEEIPDLDSLDLDLNLDLESATETQSLDTSAIDGDDALDLDFSSLGDESLEDGDLTIGLGNLQTTDSLDEQDKAARQPSDDLNIDLDLSDVDGLDLEIDMGAAGADEDSSFSVEADLSEVSELTDSADVESDSVEAEAAEGLDFDLDLANTDAETIEKSEEFDLDLGDIDMESLDKEVESLSEGFDLEGVDDDLAEPLAAAGDELETRPEPSDSADALDLDAALSAAMDDALAADTSSLLGEAASTDSVTPEATAGDELSMDLDFSSLDAELGAAIDEADTGAIGVPAGDTPPADTGDSDFAFDTDALAESLEGLDLGVEETLDDAAAETSGSPLDSQADSTDLDISLLADSELDSSLDELSVELSGADLGGDDLGALDLGEMDGLDAALEELSESTGLEVGDDFSEAQLANVQRAVAEANPDDVVDAATAEDDLDFLADTDEAATKLDLARAYIDMGDKDGARDILEEVVDEGNDNQKSEAKSLLDRIS